MRVPVRGRGRPVRGSGGAHVVMSGSACAAEFFRGKAVQEDLVANGPVPWTILRATQFHEFAQQIFGQITVGPINIVPVMRSQPVSAREVAERLVDLAVQGPQGRARLSASGSPR